MSDSFISMADKASLSPGTLIYAGPPRQEAIRIDVVNYDPEGVQKTEVSHVQDVKALSFQKNVSWIRVKGVHDVNVVQEIGRQFGIHSLVLEDILNTYQRPKTEDYGDYVFVALRMLHLDEDELVLRQEQISIVLGKGYVISFCEGPNDPFEPVLNRIETGIRRIRKKGADYLAYALVDAVVDEYFVLIGKLDQTLEEIESRMIGTPDKNTLEKLYRLKQCDSGIRRVVLPLREVVRILTHMDSDLLNDEMAPYLRDALDHVTHVIEDFEGHSETITALIDLFLNSSSYRLNEVMKVLTIVATIFIPLTFIAGVYGMNFKNMPELEWYWGYPLTLGLMVLIGSVMVLLFRRNHWL